METTLPRPRRIAISALNFKRLALLNAFLLVLIVATGATVRLTGSGLGCRHWPGCQPGEVFPAQGVHSEIEFSNRMIAGFVVLVTLVTFIASFLSGQKRWVRRATGVTFFGTFADAPLGAITVHYHLNPWLVMSHFLLSFFVLGFGVIVALEVLDVRGDPVPARLRELALLVAASCLVLLVTGTLSTAAGKHAGSADVRRIGTLHHAVWLHVRATAVFGIAFFLLLTWLVSRRSSHMRAAFVVLGLLAVQMVLGEIQYRTRLPWGLVLVHVTLSAVIWASMVWFTVALFRRPAIAAERHRATSPDPRETATAQ